jgi:hypothetical protein
MRRVKVREIMRTEVLAARESMTLANRLQLIAEDS